MALKFETIVNGPFQENCILVWDEETKKGAFIDPGDEPDRLMRSAEILNVEVEGIFNTHGHIDHAGGVARIQEKLSVPFAIHPEDRFLLDNLPQQARMFGLGEIEAPVPDRELSDSEKLIIAGHEVTVLHTPGHTPGGVCFQFEDTLIAGDTLFAGSVGRTDLPGGSMEQLVTAIKEKLFVLDEGLRVLCGHGPSTSIGIEKKHNPFLNGQLW